MCVCVCVCECVRAYLRVVKIMLLISDYMYANMHTLLSSVSDVVQLFILNLTKHRNKCDFWEAT